MVTARWMLWYAAARINVHQLVPQPADSPLPRSPGIIAKVPTNMANHAYLRVWTRDFSIETMLAEFARFLTTAPLSATQNTFAELVEQAVDATETPVAEWDLRPLKPGPAEVAALAV